jgi:hypothetical protein
MCVLYAGVYYQKAANSGGAVKKISVCQVVFCYGSEVVDMAA